jgi:hypothetical protein
VLKPGMIGLAHIFLDRIMGWIETVALCIPLSGLLAAVGVTHLPGTQVVEVQRVASAQTVAVQPRSLSSGTPGSSAPTAATSFLTLNSQQFDQQLQRYLRYLAEFGAPDILIVGSSRALQGVDPIALQRTLTSRCYPNLRIFNFGINGATAQVVDFLLRRLLTEAQLPRLILWADGVRAFNSGRIDHTYNRLQASPGYRQVLAGIRPALPARPLSFLAKLCFEVPPFLGMRLAETQPKSANSRGPTAQPAGSQMLCRHPLQALPPDPVNLSGKEVATLRQSLGFHSIETRFHPPIYFQRYPRVRGEFDGDYRDFSLQGRQTVALNQVLRFARSRQIPVVLVNLPLTPTYMDWARTRYEQQFQTFFRQFARSGQATVYDLNTPQFSRNHYFMDPSHLNYQGATVVAARLGNELATRLPQLWGSNMLRIEE